jgi:hypothetical protein
LLAAGQGYYLDVDAVEILSLVQQAEQETPMPSGRDAEKVICQAPPTQRQPVAVRFASW